MISITAPIQPALDHTRRILFEPFSLEKWFVLGFCAFLAGLGSGGYNYRSVGSPWNDAEGARSLGTWALAHLPVVIFLAALVLILVLALTILLLWIGSRGTFLFLEGVARNRAAVVEPWRRFRDLGNQLFRFRLALVLAFLGFFGLCLGAGFVLLRPVIHGGDGGRGWLVPALGLGGLFLLGTLVLVAISLLLKDFVVPVMYRRNLGIAEAWRVLRQEILPGHGWTFAGFYLMSILLWIPAAVLAILTICLTCCVALLPYLSSVALLPITVFFRCYSLCFLEQFGEDWRILETEPRP